MDGLLLRQLGIASDEPPAATAAPRPGKSTLTARLTPAPRVTLLRVEDAAVARAIGEGIGASAVRDANGVAADAEAAVDRAAGSTGAALPTALQRRFEASLDADLSRVRVHTGAASQQAARAVGAKAYTVGPDIHFADGMYQPDDPFGVHLLAHEVAHTVQQAGGAATRQHKLEVSTPHDPAEAEADRAADAMIRGEPAQVGTRRVMAARKGGDTPSNSYNRGDLKWENGTALTDEEYAAWAGKQAGLLGAAGALAARCAQWAGVSVPSVVELCYGAKIEKLTTQFEADVDTRERAIAHHQGQIDYLREKKTLSKQEQAALTEHCRQVEAEKQGLKRVLEQRDQAPKKLHQVATETVGQGVGALKAFSGIAGPINACTQTINPSIFKDMNEANGKIEAAISAVNLLGEMCDRRSFDAFQANPDFETAAAWGTQVGTIFASASGLAAALPTGLDEVYAGVLNTPQKVIAQFTATVRAYYQRVDQMTRDDCAGKQELLDGGESSTCTNRH